MKSGEGLYSGSHTVRLIRSQCGVDGVCIFHFSPSLFLRECDEFLSAVSTPTAHDHLFCFCFDVFEDIPFSLFVFMKGLVSYFNSDIIMLCL